LNAFIDACFLLLAAAAGRVSVVSRER